MPQEEARTQAEGARRIHIGPHTAARAREGGTDEAESQRPQYLTVTGAQGRVRFHLPGLPGDGLGVDDMETTLQESKIKELVKQAILELLQEEHELLSGLLVEALEDLALTNAIREGESSESVSRAEVLRALERSA